jgi:hypothetical protein
LKEEPLHLLSILLVLCVVLAVAVATILLLIWWLRKEIVHRRQLEKLVEWRTRADEQERARKTAAAEARQEGRGWAEASLTAARMLERAVQRAEVAFGVRGGRHEDDQELVELGDFGGGNVADGGEAELGREEGAVGFQNLLAVERNREEEQEVQQQQLSLRQRSRSRNRRQPE